jgi:hypothetical protein
MTRYWLLSIAVVAGAAVFSPRLACAQPISVHNPYRSYSLTGLNYASMQWEQQHRARPTSQVYAAPQPQPQVSGQPTHYYYSPQPRRFWKHRR